MTAITRNISLKPYNTFGIDAVAKDFAIFRSVEELAALLDETKPLAQQPPLILGGGSNILLTKDINGVVLKNELYGIEKVDEDEDHIYIKAGAGENWHQFVLYCLEHNYAGVENLALIPGSVGASPIQNIGAYGVEIKDVFHQLEAFHLQDKTMHTFSLQDCAFGYRDSVFKHRFKGQFVITSVTYKLFKNPMFHVSYGAIQQELERMGVTELCIQNIAQAVINIRSSKLPDWKLVGNAGSFFKNPEIPNRQYEDLKKLFPNIVAFPLPNGNVKLAAGWLIEQCGWKGYRKGDAGCYPKQALVLVNYGRATGAEIYSLSEEILQSVQKKFGVTLEREVYIS
jgi:UDP-N-acetylmuramate dehydrogenase